MYYDVYTVARVIANRFTDHIHRPKRSMAPLPAIMTFMKATKFLVNHTSYMIQKASRVGTKPTLKKCKISFSNIESNTSSKINCIVFGVLRPLFPSS